MKMPRISVQRNFPSNPVNSPIYLLMFAFNPTFSLPYCEAIVCESARFFMSYTMGIAHRCLRDTKFRSHDIPKDTMLVACFDGMMNDPKIIKNPSQFDPENFLDENGKFSMPDKHFPFALGKHRCIGETLAKSNLFLLCTTLLQNFSFELPPGHDSPTDVPIDGATPSVQDFTALIIPRP
jgi:cytochrome P450